MLELSEPRPPLVSAEGCLNQPAANLDDGACLEDDDACFEPIIAREAEPPAPKPVERPRNVLGDLFNQAMGIVPTPADARPASELPPPGPSEIPTQPVKAPFRSPRVATATELVHWIKRVLLAKTHLSDHAAGLVAIWVISTWHQSALKVYPCLVITGAAYDATPILHLLKKFCPGAALVAGFAPSHLEALRRCRTNLISEPNLDKRSANLLSSLTDREFWFVSGNDFAWHSKSTAIYAGESPEIHTIRNSIHIHLAPNSAVPTDSPAAVEIMIRRIPTHLEQYRDKNIGQVRSWTWTSKGVSSERAIAATELGRSIVGAPELRQKLLDLLKTEDKERLAEMSNTPEALVLEATLNLCHAGKEQIRVGDIAAEVNRIATERGERLKQSAEKIGHVLKKIGLTTRRLGSVGKGLVIDRATITRLHELAGLYGGAGLEACEQNLNCRRSTENK